MSANGGNKDAAVYPTCPTCQSNEVCDFTAGACVACKSGADGVFDGTVQATTQAKVDALAGVREINGDLSIGIPGTLTGAFTSLGALGCLERLSGNFAIDGLLPPTGTGFYGQVSLDGLARLTSVGGNFTLSKSTLNDFTPFSHLTSVGGDVLFSNGSGTSLAGFENLSAIGGSVEFSYTKFDSLSGLSDQLTTIHGDLTIFSTLLTSLAGLESLTKVEGAIAIASNDQLVDIEGLSGVKGAVGDLRFSKNALLTSIGPLAKITACGVLSVENCPVLNNLDGLQNVTAATSVFIRRDPLLRNLAPLHNISGELEQLTISDNSALTDLSGLEHVASAKFVLAITDNTSLTSLTGISALTNVSNSCTITGNTALPQCAVDAWKAGATTSDSAVVKPNGSTSAALCQ